VCSAFSSYGINGVQAPLIGFLPLGDETTNTNVTSSSTPAVLVANATTTTMNIKTTQPPFGPTPTQIDTLTLTTTVNVELPNAVLPDPTFATLPYAFGLGHWAYCKMAD